MAKRIDQFPDPTAGRAATARDLAARLRAEYPPEHRHRVLDDVAGDLGRNYRTVVRYVAEADEYTQRRPPRRGRPKRWTDDQGRAAVRAWIARHGRPPSTMDWSPAKLRARGWATAADRLARFEEGWVDAEGRHQPYPHASSVSLRRWITEVTA